MFSRSKFASSCTSRKTVSGFARVTSPACGPVISAGRGKVAAVFHYLRFASSALLKRFSELQMPSWKRPRSSASRATLVNRTRKKLVTSGNSSYDRYFTRRHVLLKCRVCVCRERERANEREERTVCVGGGERTSFVWKAGYIPDDCGLSRTPAAKT